MEGSYERSSAKDGKCFDRMIWGYCGGRGDEWIELQVRKYIRNYICSMQEIYNNNWRIFTSVLIAFIRSYVTR